MGQRLRTAVSLFAGVGGFDLALERAGVKVVASVEIDKKAQEVLRRHFPDSTIFGDVTGVTGEQADSNRYKQMGNAVAVPVVSWIINRVVGEE